MWVDEGGKLAGLSRYSSATTAAGALFVYLVLSNIVIVMLLDLGL